MALRVDDISINTIIGKGSAIIHGHYISIKDEAEYKRTSDEYLQSKAIKEKVIL